MITVILSRFIILIFGTLYPAYASYKAVRHKDVKEYLKWIMYWIVFAFFTCCETFTDVFLSWFPFYYELKVAIVIWLLSPITEGSSVLYRNFVHPMLTKREKEIDEYINQAKEKGCSAVIQLGSKGVNYATSVIMQTALKVSEGGGNLVSTLRKSYSLSDLSEPDLQRSHDEVDEILYGQAKQMIQYRRIQPNQRYMRANIQNQHVNGINRSSSTSRTVDVYYDDMMSRSSDNYDYIRSSEDVSSGYSSTEPVSMALSRTSSLTNPTRLRPKTKRTEPRQANGGTYKFNGSRIMEVNDESEATLATIGDISNLDMKYELFRKWLRQNDQNAMLPDDREVNSSTLLTEDEEKVLSSSTTYSTIPRTRKSERDRTVKNRLRTIDK
ncbi:receptor expression-enhancing protein 2 isoform X3 [Sitodiplosis mosellana]|uniref:receptor expression-enhancing protein 2 isoform X3 n=1 Tax=Sitodiplosis mosellana TaxID=263140 RepID=UPI002444638D|nr:receptor expression-enhancing protein 2 isoform X3 [Sitodiplosis mosellana]